MQTVIEGMKATIQAMSEAAGPTKRNSAAPNVSTRTSELTLKQQTIQL